MTDCHRAYLIQEVGVISVKTISAKSFSSSERKPVLSLSKDLLPARR